MLWKWAFQYISQFFSLEDHVTAFDSMWANPDEDDRFPAHSSHWSRRVKFSKEASKMCDRHRERTLTQMPSIIHSRIIDDILLLRSLERLRVGFHLDHLKSGSAAQIAADLRFVADVDTIFFAIIRDLPVH